MARERGHGRRITASAGGVGQVADGRGGGEVSSWHSYPKIWAVGHSAAAELFDGPVVVEEKIDGSQFSFGMIDGELRCRSKGAQLIVDAPEKMFTRAIESVRERAELLYPGWTYRAEYLQSAKHNTLGYERHPKDHLIIFDVNPGEEQYLPYDEKAAEANRIGLECVPLMHCGAVNSADEFRAFLERESILGKAKVEGVVVKNYAKFGPDKKALMGKYVSEAFKELHGKEWKKSNPGNADIIEGLIERMRTDGRWAKGVQHLRDDGKLQGDPRDIAELIKAVQQDIKDECSPEIIASLMSWAMPKILRGVVRGLPEWYKDRLMASAFEVTP